MHASTSRGILASDMCLGTLAHPTANRLMTPWQGRARASYREAERAGKGAGAPKPLLMMHSIVQSEP